MRRTRLILCLAAGLLVCGTPAAYAVPFAEMLQLPAPESTRRASVMVALPPGGSYTLLDTDGPGCITHIWMTVGTPQGHALVLRMYWDRSELPAVEVPLTYFFGVGHDENAPSEPFVSSCLAVAPVNGYNAFWPMPFREHARIVVTNESGLAADLGGGVYFQGTYQTFDELPDDTPYFHAAWRREAPADRRGAPHTVVQAVGDGFVAGLTLHVRVHDSSDMWFHGGGDFVYLDGARTPNLLQGIGGEDFIGQSWTNARFIMPHAGCTVADDERVSLYRYFVEGPLRFRESAHVAFGAMANDITSVGYWYQRAPHTPFVSLPPLSARTADTRSAPGAYDHELEADRQFNVAVIGPFAGDIDTTAPLDGLHPIDTSLALRTNYERLYRFNDVLFDRMAVRWERTRTVLGWLDLSAAFRPKMPEMAGVSHMPNTFAYALLRVDSGEARSVRLRIGHDDPVRVWLNGTLVAALEARHGFRGEDVPLALNAGTNEILIKAANGWNSNFAAWALALSFGDRDALIIDDWAGLPSVFEPFQAPDGADTPTPSL